MKVAVLCEVSGRIRDAFRARGHDVISCDLEPTENPGPHIQDDCRNHDWSKYDLIIAHPPCTYLSVVGNRAMKENPNRIYDRFEAFDFFMWCYFLPVEKICVENPVGYINTHFRKPDQIIHPYYFEDCEMKRTCLWLRGLPPLINPKQYPLLIDGKIKKPKPKWKHKIGTKKAGQNVYFTEMNPGKKARSRTFPGIAAAMAEQWGK